VNDITAQLNCLPNFLFLGEILLNIQIVLVLLSKVAPGRVMEGDARLG